MAEDNISDFVELVLDDKNYLTWLDNCQFHLETTQFRKTIDRLGQITLACSFIRKQKLLFFFSAAST